MLPFGRRAACELVQGYNKNSSDKGGGTGRAM